jgi:hypothetical protein
MGVVIRHRERRKLICLPLINVQIARRIVAALMLSNKYPNLLSLTHSQEPLSGSMVRMI